MRKDGTRVKDANPIYTVMPYILKYRYDAMNMIEVDVPISPMQSYLNEKRKQGYRFSHLGVVLAAYVRTAAEYPLLNRFIANKRIYQRNEFSVAMVVLKPGEMDGTMSKMYFKMDDDIFSVHETMERYVVENRAEGDTNATDDIVRTLLKIPGLVNFGVGLLRFMDRYGLMPKSLIQASPFHTSLTISNLASIRTNHIFHHVYEFGTTSILITLGNMREIPVRKGEEIVFERSLPMGVVMDERICSGSYFAAVFRRFKQYLTNPELLEHPPAVINTALD
ncbi:MAG: 2-oxo acid dehydrogenase subunit E2 [Eubacteriales bacterium]|nr:2-oxo acid dehydrogenase subunit E2 [Eubacteriales bacterium]